MLIFCLDEVATAKGLDKTQLHYQSGVSYPTVLRIWNNNNVKQVDLEVLGKFCDLLNCEPGDLLKRSPVPRRSGQPE